MFRAVLDTVGAVRHPRPPPPQCPEHPQCDNHRCPLGTVSPGESHPSSRLFDKGRAGSHALRVQHLLGTGLGTRGAPKQPCQEGCGTQGPLLVLGGKHKGWELCLPGIRQPEIVSALRASHTPAWELGPAQPLALLLKHFRCRHSALKSDRLLPKSFLSLDRGRGSQRGWFCLQDTGPCRDICGRHNWGCSWHRGVGPQVLLSPHSTQDAPQRTPQPSAVSGLSLALRFCDSGPRCHRMMPGYWRGPPLLCGGWGVMGTRVHWLFTGMPPVLVWAGAPVPPA